jgi:hypothetical protein
LARAAGYGAAAATGIACRGDAKMETPARSGVYSLRKTK